MLGDFLVTSDKVPAFLGVRTVYMNEDNENIQQRNKACSALLSEARSGNQASMGRLAGIVRERLYPFVFRTTLDHDLTEDVLQETLLTMVGQVARLRDKDRFWPWVFRIAWNKIQDNLRRRKHQSSGKASLVQNQSYVNRADGGNILDATIHAEKLQQLSEMVDQLSWQHRDILRLRYYEQLPYAEIAALTSTTPQKARARFYRAKKFLKARML
jgi:RNA polymerase sigma-70 factor (ECF subfamily)